ncbi:helix-turn-helix domain-containing protein [Kribbella sancticallisti]|uniref:Helix-turn-helix domain-containing protein n=1 Tax=Kribbella sancticallisti TaxID=460087 RepID=A0ABN2DYJ8_9ACTN
MENPVDNRLAELERRIAALESTTHAPQQPSPPDDDALEALAGREDWSRWATSLAALGNPVRLTLLREIVRGNNTVSALSAVEGLGTSGQIYHHLRQLTAEGWLHSPSRGIFALPPTRVVALLEILVALER